MPLATIMCPHCSASPVSVLSQFVEQIDTHGQKAVCGFVCPFCKKPIGAWIKNQVGRSSLVAMKQDKTFEDAGWMITDIWPGLAVISAPTDTPPEIERIFIQAENARRRREHEMSGMAYRKALELAVKDQGQPGRDDLYARINKLPVTQQLKDWAHAVRMLGNDAAHDPVEPSDEELDDLAAFTRVFLEYVYSLPMKVTRRSTAPPPASP